MGASSKRRAKANNIMSTSILTKGIWNEHIGKQEEYPNHRGREQEGTEDRDRKGKASHRRLLCGACSPVQYTVKNQTHTEKILTYVRLLFLQLSNAQIFHVFINRLNI